MALWLIKLLLAEFAVLFIVAMFERKWALALWAAGAALIQFAVIGWSKG